MKVQLHLCKTFLFGGCSQCRARHSAGIVLQTPVRTFPTNIGQTFSSLHAKILLDTKKMLSPKFCTTSYLLKRTSRDKVDRSQC